MRKYMKKPEDIDPRSFNNILSKIDKSLLLFPRGSDNLKFTPNKLHKMLEGSLPLKWWQKFDFRWLQTI